MAEPPRTPPFLLERFYTRNKVIRGNCIGASLRWTRSRAWRKPARILCGLSTDLAASHRAQRRDRTNVFMCHWDHLLQLP